MKKVLIAILFTLLSVVLYSQSSDYYTIGSTKKQVLRIQGEPDRINEYDILNESTWYYGSSSVDFKNGKVKQYSNSGKNLLIKLNNENQKLDKKNNEPKEGLISGLTPEIMKKAKEEASKITSFTGLGLGIGQAGPEIPSYFFDDKYQPLRDAGIIGNASEYRGFYTQTYLDDLLARYYKEQVIKYSSIGIGVILIILIAFYINKNRRKTKPQN